MSCLNTSQGLDRVSIVVSQAGQGILKPQRIVPQFSWSRPKSQHAWKKTHNSGISPQIWVLTPHSSGYSAARLRLLPHSTQKGEKLSFLSLLVSLVGVTVCGFRRCVRFSWGWVFKIFQDLCPLVIRKNSFNVPGHLSENL